MNKQDLQVDYDAHPAFPQRGFIAELPDGQMNVTAELFEEAVQAQPSNARKSLNSLLVHVGEVMNQLGAQYPDDLTRTFFDVLSRRSSMVLQSQIKYLRKSVKVAPHQTSDATNKLMSERRYVVHLSPDVLAEMRETADQLASRFRKFAEAGKLRRDDLSVNQGSVVRHLTAQLNREFARNGTLASVSQLSGTPMCVGGLALELSHPSSTWWRHSVPGLQAPKTMYAHLDEAVAVPKAIVYLSDVDLQNGPTSSFLGVWDEMELNPLTDAVGRIVGSVMKADSPLHDYFDDGSYHQTLGSAKFRRLFMSLPPALRFNSHLGWDVIPGSALEHRLVEREETLLGEAGTTIVFDGGRLFHRGGLIEAGERLVCQAVFAPAATRTLRSRVARRVKRIAS